MDLVNDQGFSLAVTSTVSLGTMPIKYLFLVNKQGQTRISKYYENVTVENRVAIEADIIRKCLGRNDTQVRIYAPKLSKEP